MSLCVKMTVSGTNNQLITHEHRKSAHDAVETMSEIYREAITKVHFVYIAMYCSVVFHFSFEKFLANGLTKDGINQYLKKHVNMHDSRVLVTYRVDDPVEKDPTDTL